MEQTQTTEKTCDQLFTTYLFQPAAEVKEGVAGVCERCARLKYPLVLTVQRHLQMSVCVHLYPNTTAHSDVMQFRERGTFGLKNT